MARHNRIARGVDQCQQAFEILFHPDWLRRLRVTRRLKGGRQSTMNIFRNPSQFRSRDPGSTIRTEVKSLDGTIDFAITLHDPALRIRQVTVTVEPTRDGPLRSGPIPHPDEIRFTFDGDLRSVPGR